MPRSRSRFRSLVVMLVLPWFVTPLLVLPLLTSSAGANDGRDRYRRSQPNLLQLFPDPGLAGSGYRMLAADAPGGADGDDAFRWARPHAIALVRIAARRTYQQMGSALVPMAIFDASAENGDTPIQWTPGKPPRGRHPGGSHDGGLNLDLGYYLTSTVGQRYTPDHAACTDHFSPTKPDAKPRDAYQCLGPPDRLDTDRQTFFLLRVLLLDQQLFSGRLIENIGIDRQIRDVVLDRAATWARRRRHGATRALVARLKQVCTADRWEGWARSHHHHVHLRLRDGHDGSGRQRLLAIEREIDAAAGAKDPVGRWGKKQVPHLRVRLLSYGLQRAVELELLAAPGQQHEAGLAVAFRVTTGDGRWTAPDPAALGRIRAVLDLPQGFRPTAKPLVVQARLVRSAGDELPIKAALIAPRSEPWLAIAIDSSQLWGVARPLRRGLELTVVMPQAYRALITGVTYRVHRAKGWVDEVVGDPRHPAFVGRTRASHPRLIEARVLASGRQTINVPVYFRRAEGGGAHPRTKR